MQPWRNPLTQSLLVQAILPVAVEIKMKRPRNCWITSLALSIQQAIMFIQMEQQASLPTVTDPPGVVIRIVHALHRETMIIIRPVHPDTTITSVRQQVTPARVITRTIWEPGTSSL